MIDTDGIEGRGWPNEMNAFNSRRGLNLEMHVAVCDEEENNK